MLASCSKESLDADSIVGTMWKSDVYDGNATMDIEFSSKSDASFTLYVNGVVRLSDVIPYILDYPEITFSLHGDIMTGRFTDKKTLKLREGASDADYFVTLHKQ